MNSPNRISALIAHLALSCALSFGCVDPQEATISGYPEAPAYATATVHVNPFGEAAVPNGTVDKPFPTVRAAIESFATPPGAAIVIVSAPLTAIRNEDMPP